MSDNFFIQHPEVTRYILKHEAQEITPEQQIRNLIVALHGTAWAKSQAGQLDNIRSQASYLLLQFDKYTRGQLQPIPADDPFCKEV